MQSPRFSLRRRGFTLIELLIVIAIILILISIALPNFLEAQIRAKVTKATADIRGIGIAAELYFNDFGAYPGESEPVMAEQDRTSERGLLRLTTPIPYIRQVPEDPFPHTMSEGYNIGEIHFYSAGGCAAEETRLIMAQAGPLFGVWTRGPSGTGAGRRASRRTAPGCSPSGRGRRHGGEVWDRHPSRARRARRRSRSG